MPLDALHQPYAAPAPPYEGTGGPYAHGGGGGTVPPGDHAPGDGSDDRSRFRSGDGSGRGSGRPDTAVVLAHGFTGSVDRPAVRRAAGVFGRYAAVVTFSFRGHGRSGGRSTVGDREVLDLAAAVGWARELGHARVVTVGFSMGGSVALRHAALHRDDPATRTDAVVAVSAPARWYYRGTAPMRRLHWVVTRPAGRLVGRWGLRTRIQPYDWDPVPLPPVRAVPLIAPVPLLVVHGDRDPYFPLDHPRSLAAAGPAELWVEPGMGHAENAADEGLLTRIAEWACRTERGCQGDGP
ncbi:alpha/beta hydrolase [Streptomyces sp. LP05-1]|uniref:Alpha/beta hydrolase n=1 Tax=Streptomyces pyxinae TaxID=2970734 RepID=A0ABT2CMZ2_9ACTN|nr:alpha/beta hydrolase [Streptomyces sp. LP05-1]MCS0638803.1 alpha/beta hydrolase [Streptomyces sp. LP05-1]